MRRSLLPLFSSLDRSASLLLVLPFIFSIACKKENTNNDCPKTPIDKTVQVTDIRGHKHLYVSLQELSFLSDPTFVLDSVDLSMTISTKDDHGNKGKGKSKNNKNRRESELSLSLNSLKVIRKDGHKVLEVTDPVNDLSTAKSQLHKLYISGAQPFDRFIVKLRQKKGLMKISPLGRNVQIVNATVTFKGSTQAKCETPPPPPPAPEIAVAQIDVVQPNTNPTNMTSISFEFSSQVAASLYMCSIDGAAANTCSSPTAYSNLTNGGHSFSVYAVNSAGVAGPASNYNWVVDAVALTVAITNAGQLPTLTNNTSITFDFISTKAGTFFCSIDDAAPTACLSSQSYSGLSDGAHLFSLIAVDSLGNSSQPATFQWVVDLTPPQVSFVNISPAQDLTNLTSKAFSFTADEAAQFACSLDNQAFTNCSSTFDTGTLTEGSHWFSVQATDLAGNTGTAATYSWTIDLTAPTFELGVSPTQGLTNSNDISVSFFASEPSTAQCTFDGSAYPCTNSFTINDVSDGNHQLLVVLTDAVGNQSEQKIVNWAVDTTAPLIGLEGIYPTIVNSGNLSFAINGADDSTLTVALNGQTLPQHSSPISLTGLSQGDYTLTAVAQDAAGNISNTISHSFTIDLTAPSVNLTASSQVSPTNIDQISFSFAASEAAVFQCDLDQTGFADCASPMNYTGVDDGTHIFSVRAIDLAGNVSGTKGYSWTVDTQAPITGATVSQSGSSITFSLSANEENVTYTCSLDGASATACGSTVTYNLAAGSHSFFAQATDAAGNIDPAGFASQFTVDSIAPVASNIAFTSTTNSFTVTWITDEPSTTQLLYGTSTTPNLLTTEDTTLTTNHTVTVTGLPGRTTYFFQVTGKDGSGNKYVSPGTPLSVRTR
jgi:hypothetical protein